MSVRTEFAYIFKFYLFWCVLINFSFFFQKILDVAFISAFKVFHLNWNNTSSKRYKLVKICMNVNQPLLNSIKVPSFPLPSFYSKQVLRNSKFYQTFKPRPLQNSNIFFFSKSLKTYLKIYFNQFRLI